MLFCFTQLLNDFWELVRPTVISKWCIPSYRSWHMVPPDSIDCWNILFLSAKVMTLTERDVMTAVYQSAVSLQRTCPCVTIGRMCEARCTWYRTESTTGASGARWRAWQRVRCAVAPPASSFLSDVGETSTSSAASRWSTTPLTPLTTSSGRAMTSSRSSARWQISPTTSSRWSRLSTTTSWPRLHLCSRSTHAAANLAIRWFTARSFCWCRTSENDNLIRLIQAFKTSLSCSGRTRATCCVTPTVS